MGEPLLDAIRCELYGGPRQEFVARRAEQAKAAKAAGDRELAAAIAALRKPNAAAHVVNLLARQASDQLSALLDVGARLRTALETGEGELRDLLRARTQAVVAMMATARDLAREDGHPLSDAVAEDVARTLRAAMATDEAAAAVRSGTLAEPLEEPELVALPTTARPRARRATPPRPRSKAARDATAKARRTPAEDPAAEAERAAAAAGVAARVAAAEADHDAATQRRAALEARRRSLEAELAALDDDLAEARRAERAAAEAHRAAQEELQRARAAPRRAPKRG